MKKFSDATLAAARHPQAMARLVLAFVASILVILLALIGMSSGPNGATVFAQATESPTAAPDNSPAVKLLNPSQAYDPNLIAPARPPGEPDPPKISDKFDGVDNLYHVVAVTRNAPANSTIEAYFQPDAGFGIEMTVGVLTQVAGQPDTWEMFWDIPDAMISTPGTFKVVLFGQGPTGFEEIASDETEARVDRNEETAEFSWPSQGGQLGFHKPKGGLWRTVVEGTASGAGGGAVRVAVFYSVTPIGEDPEFTRCAYVNIGAATENRKPFVASCALAGKALPSEVTSMAVVAIEDDVPNANTNANAYTQESADVHRVSPYVQDVSTMTVDVVGLYANGEVADSSYPTPRRRQAMKPFNPDPESEDFNPFPTGCLKFKAVVKDHLGRPVQGANLDAHVVGPNDQAGFGSDNRNTADPATEDSVQKPPDKGHDKEGARFCLDYEDTPEDDRGTAVEGVQGDHNVPGGADIKHVETIAGTGLDPVIGSSTAFAFGPGESRFFIFSFQPGFSDLTFWVDDEPLVNEATAREADDDTPELSEPSATVRAQWLPRKLALSIVPRSDAAPVGECNKYTVRARAGTAVVPNINIDVHAQGPNNDLDFCDPGDGSARRAPDKPTGDTAHQLEDEGESSHKSPSPETAEVQHTEGETDDAGNFVIGITSSAVGQTSLTAWVDGETGEDNDVLDSSEVRATASKTWAGSAADAQVRLVNPSAYGGAGDKISNRKDADNNFHLVARVDLPDVVPGVEFFLGSAGTFTKIGDGIRVGSSDTWEFYWPVNVADGPYTLRAQIPGTEKRDDRAVTVNSQANPQDPRDVGLETAEITRPLNATTAPFDKGATTLSGVASAGARGVNFYYTKAPASQALASGDWIRCGGVALPGSSATQNFEGKCDLKDPDGDGTKDFPAEVTGVAVLAYRCEPTGCATVDGRETGRILDTGDAHRVFGFEANPVVTIEPPEAAGKTAECKRFELSVKDGSGLGIADANIDLHLTGPTDSAEFCDLADGSPRRAPDQAGHSASPSQTEEGIHSEEGSDAHHTEGETDAGGKFVFGIISGTSGDSQILAWADVNDNDELDTNEKSDTSIMHWGGGGGSSKCTIKGNRRDNVLRGTSGADVICGGGGDDVIRGRGGKDKIYGGGGNDTLRGNGGGDLIKGGPGNDRLDGGRGRDRCRPGRGRDSRVNCE